jgi:hypothetical protein
MKSARTRDAVQARGRKKKQASLALPAAREARGHNAAQT